MPAEHTGDRNAQDPIRVLLVTDKLGYAGARLHGAGRLVVAWTEAFDPARVKILAYVLRDPGRLDAGFERDGVPITFLGLGRYDPRAILRLVGLIRAHRIDVLHLQEFGASTFGRIAGFLTRRPTVIHVHAEYDGTSIGGYPLGVRAIDRILSSLTTRVVAVSHSVAEFCVARMGFRRPQVVVIHNPLTRDRRVDESALAALRQLYQLPADAPVVGVVTRFYPPKGNSFLLEAFARVLQTVPDSRLLMVGDGPERSALEAQARSLGIQQRVIFAGFRDDVEAHVKLFRVAVIPSLHEGLPLAGIEALSAGVPLVATRIGGLPELVSNGGNGFLVEPANAAAIADAVVRILQDPELERNLKAGALRDAHRFSMETFVERMEKTYREAVEARHGDISAPGATWRSRGWRVVRLVIAFTLLTLVVSRVNWSEVRSVLSRTRLTFLPVIFLLYTLDRLWMAWKWHYLLRGLGVQVRFYEVIRHYYLGGLLGAAVQSQLGGDIARASAVGRHAGRTRVVAASVVIEKAVGFIAAGILAGVSLILVHQRYDVSGAVLLAAAVPVGLAIALVPTLAYPQFTSSLLLRLLNVYPGLAGKLRLAGILTNAPRLQQAGSTLRRFFGLTLAEQLVPLANLFLIREALRLDISAYAILAFTPLIMFFARLPISIEALGIYEGLSIYLFGLAGLSAASALALALLDRVMGLVVLGVGALVFAWASRSRG